MQVNRVFAYPQTLYLKSLSDQVFELVHATQVIILKIPREPALVAAAISDYTGEARSVLVLLSLRCPLKDKNQARTNQGSCRTLVNAYLKGLIDLIIYSRLWKEAH